MHVYIQRQKYPRNWNLENRRGAPRLKQHFSRTFSNNEKNILKNKREIYTIFKLFFFQTKWILHGILDFILQNEISRAHALHVHTQHKAHIPFWLLMEHIPSKIIKCTILFNYKTYHQAIMIKTSIF